MESTIAVDLAKSVFEVAVSRRPGRVAESHRLTRAQFTRFFAKRQPTTVLFEACSSAHHWGRRLRRLGHTVVLLPPHLVSRYRGDGRKTDRADAKALLEASRNEEICPVPIKTLEQHSLAALHRLRSRWMATRTARLNTIRGVLRELGLVIPVGARHVVAKTRAWLADPDSDIPDPIRPALAEACDELRQLEERVRGVERQLGALARQIPSVATLQSIPGIGLLTATALVGFVGDATRFKSGRRFASYLGLTPREHSSGSVRRLGSISKKGDPYLRMLLTHGARSVLCTAARHKQPTPLALWALELRRRRGHNIAAIALANKLARIVWATWSRQTPFEPDIDQAT